MDSFKSCDRKRGLKKRHFGHIQYPQVCTIGLCPTDTIQECPPPCVLDLCYAIVSIATSIRPPPRLPGPPVPLNICRGSTALAALTMWKQMPPEALLLLMPVA